MCAHLNALLAPQRTQEVVPLNASNIVMGADVTSARQWVAHVERYLQSPTTPTGDLSHSQSWVLVASKQMVGVFLAVWARTTLVAHIHGVQTLSVPTGMLGLLGNKGAVAVRLRVAETGLVLVCSHLSSGDKPGDDSKRNADVATIVERGMFGVDDISVGDAELARRLRAVWGGGAQNILQHDHVVWVGDLNYRLRGISDAAARTVCCAFFFLRLVGSGLVGICNCILLCHHAVCCAGHRGGTAVQAGSP